MFRHSYIYINKRSGIRSAADLNGKRIGVQNWLTTTAVWARGLLEDEYGLDPKSVTWVADRLSGVGDWKPPAWLKIEIIPKEQKQFDLLAAGKIDAAITTGTWAPQRSPGYRFSISQLRRAGTRLLQAHGFLSDHAHAADQNFGLRKKSLGSDEPVQRLARIEKEMLRMAPMATRAPDRSLVPRAMGRRAVRRRATIRISGVFRKPDRKWISCSNTAFAKA